MDDAAARLEGFLDKFLPAVAAQARAAVARLQARLPECDALVYDNYNALAIGFSPDGKAGTAILSLAIFPRWVTLCFLQGAGLVDPAGLLKGSGSRVRHIRLATPDDLDAAPIARLIDCALAGAKMPPDPSRHGALAIKSISAKQRPRRPAGG